MSTSDIQGGYHHGDLKRALVEEALALLGEEGADGIGLRQLARRVGVSPAAPYRHFAGRQALLEAVAAEGFRRFAVLMDTARTGLPEDGQLVAMAQAYVQFALEQPSLFRLMFSRQVDKQGNVDLQAAAREAYASLATAAAREDEAAPAETAVITWSFVHGLAMLLLDDQILGVSPDNRDSLVRRLAGRFVAGIRAAVAHGV
ncbi:MAG TPA: TetR/AcrR family transcriptional regulator [Devosiaceae bacterium]|jgi:AcrR family transcriptional regulator|nr:TetR/AcrR family transcriptional regulator [Devosiaceae bacterium]